MIPNFEIFGKTFSFYMIIITVGIFVLLFFTYKMAEKSGHSGADMLYMLLIGLACALVGSHLLYGVTMFPQIQYILSHTEEIQSFSDFMEWAKLIFGGSVFYGGMLAAVAGGGWYWKKKYFPVAYVDIAACGIPLFHFFGRLGCFFSGCCYGIPCKFGIVYHHHYDPAINGIRLFPVQLMESLFNLGLFLVLFTLYKKGKCKGKLMYIYLIAYPIFRFADEFLRGDTIRGFVGPFSTSQVISLVVLAAVIPYVIYTAVKEKKQKNKEMTEQGT